jgi:hypothetical protein
MRTRVVVVPALIVAVTATAVLAQQPHPPAARRRPATAGAPHSAAGGAADGGAASATGGADGGVASAGGDGGSAAPAQASTFDLPMTQRGSGAINHYPIPEQLARTAVPVFVQVSSTAPIDHVSLFYRGAGGSRFREVRMTAMGQEAGLTGGYGAQIPCEDAFPPAVEYYVQSVATSGDPVGSAGSQNAPIRLPIVLQRTHTIVPTLPGQPPPRNCGGMMVPVATRPAGTGPSATGPASADAGVGTSSESTTGTADLGEPCTRNSDCHRGLRCGSNHQCVFIAGHH